MFFVNGSCLNNQQLALENLLCYVANVRGLDTVNAAIQSVDGAGNLAVGSLLEVFSRILPATSLQGRQAFRSALVRLAGNQRKRVSRRSRSLFEQPATPRSGEFQVRDWQPYLFACKLPHIVARRFCRRDRQKQGGAGRRSPAQTVRSFSVPYGSSVDLTDELAAHLRHEGYKAVFLAEGRANSSRTSLANP